jgi:hypothetical protein
MIGALLALAAAGAAPAGLPGVWEGTIGGLPVRACFADRQSGAFGSYYYLSRKRAIALSPEEGRDGIFYEGNGAPADQPRWRIESAGGDRLTGRWTGGARTLPVRLTRVTGDFGEEGPCGSLAFHQPRLDGIRVVPARASVEGVAYTKLALDHGGRFEASLETFALDGQSEAVRRINAALGRALAGSPPQWFQCIQDSLAQSAFEGSFDESLVPAMISRRWLSVATHWDGFCGGAHPSSANAHRLFDLSSGAEVELLDWFGDEAVKRERLEQVDEVVRTVRPALREAILAGWRPEDPECAELIRGAEFWDVGLARGAFVFAPSLPHVAQACGEDFTIPFARIRTLLSPQGAEHLRAFEAEAAPRRPA